MLFKNRTLGWDLALVLGVATVLTIVVILFNLDTLIAQAVYTPQSKMGWFLRQYSNIPGVAVTLAVLVFLLVPPLRLRFPLLRRFALIWLGTLIIGGGLFAGFLLKEAFERPRPRDSVLLEQTMPATSSLEQSQKAVLKGKSFPSGHAAMAFTLVVPFFVLRRRMPRTARALLAGGIAYGLVVGYGRMVLGAHFFTDVVWSGAVMLGTAALFSAFITEKTDFKARYLASLLLVIGFVIMHFNHFKLELTWQPEQPQTITLNLPCSNAVIENARTLTVHLKGYGAPVSYLELAESNGVLKLVRYKGYYRSLKCTVDAQTEPRIE